MIYYYISRLQPTVNTLKSQKRNNMSIGNKPVDIWLVTTCYNKPISAGAKLKGGYGGGGNSPPPQLPISQGTEEVCRAK